MQPLKTNPLPPSPAFRKLIGPSFIILGLGLGSGEVILWPYLVSHHGLGIVWAIVVGITLQFFINMEIERYALINGESIFVGFARLSKYLPLWFILSTILGFMWPGIGLAGSTLIGNIIPGSNIKLIAISSFILIGLILSLGKILYQTVETIQKILVGFGTPFIIALTLYLIKPGELTSLTNGLIGIGHNYMFFPSGLSVSTFLAALVFSGAGGNLNLSQSFYVRDKGYGMGKYAEKIRSLLTNSPTNTQLTGSTFKTTQENIAIYKSWWAKINLEHFLVFLVVGAGTMVTLGLLAFTTNYGKTGNVEGILFVVSQATYISQSTLPIIGVMFLAITGLMLTATQLTVLDSTSRIITENLLLLSPKTGKNVSKFYYLILWIQILVGITIINFSSTQPKQLIIISAVMNSVTMAIYCLLLVKVNTKLIASPLRPSIFRKLALLTASVTYASLFILTLINETDVF